MKSSYTSWNSWDCIMASCNRRLLCSNFALSLSSGWRAFSMLFWMSATASGFCILSSISRWPVSSTTHRRTKYLFTPSCRASVSLICSLRFSGSELTGSRASTVSTVSGSHCSISASDELNCNVSSSAFSSSFCLSLSLVGKSLNLPLVLTSCSFTLRVDGASSSACCKSCWPDWFSCFMSPFLSSRVDTRAFICSSSCWILSASVPAGLWEAKASSAWVKASCTGCKALWYFSKASLASSTLIFFSSTAVCNASQRLLSSLKSALITSPSAWHTSVRVLADSFNSSKSNLCDPISEASPSSSTSLSSNSLSSHETG